MTGTAHIPIVQGEYAVKGVPGVVISTLLGSCVAACLYDPVARVGGMNHFLLPAPGADHAGDRAELQRYGVHSMELLINEMMRLGAMRSRLKAHLYGGANLFSGLSAIGSANGEFARNFMRTEGIAIAHSDLGGRNARKVEFQPYEGKVRSNAVADTPRLAIKPQPVALPTGGELELF
ncbi:MAG: hypothetical protein RIS17_1856 [Pseudomonadota bacterium]